MSEYKLLAGVSTLYLLEDSIFHADESNPSECEFKESALAMRHTLLTVLCNVYHDYSFCACLGEARHGSRYADVYAEFPFGSSDRSSVYAHADELEPYSAWKLMIRSFDSCWSNSAYGGYAWATIARAGLKLRELIDRGASDEKLLAHLDYVVDLSHNNGTFISKRCDVLDMNHEYAYNYMGCETHKTTKNTYFYTSILNAKRDGGEGMAYLTIFTCPDVYSIWRKLVAKKLNMSLRDISIKARDYLEDAWNNVGNEGTPSIQESAPYSYSDVFEYDEIIYGSDTLSASDDFDNFKFESPYFHFSDMPMVRC